MKLRIENPRLMARLYETYRDLFDAKIKDNPHIPIGDGKFYIVKISEDKCLVVDQRTSTTDVWEVNIEDITFTYDRDEEPLCALGDGCGSIEWGRLPAVRLA